MFRRRESATSSGPGWRLSAISFPIAWGGYRKLDQKGFEHTATVLSSQEEPTHALFPWAHISLSNPKRILLGTHHQVEASHLKRYVAEFNYRLNRRTMENDLLPRLLRACSWT
jgi:hypothetical protein